MLTCIATILINLTNQPWNKHDLEVKDFASKRCVVHYQNSPCLKKFIKKDKQTYNAICTK